MLTDTYSVKLIPQEDGDNPLNDYCWADEREGNRTLNVVDRSPTDKTITVKYGGAYSGYYYVCVNSTHNGPLESIGVVF